MPSSTDPVPAGREDRDPALTALLRASLFLTAELDLESLLQRVADAARQLVRARYAAMGAVARDGRSLERFVTAGISAAERERIGDLPVGRGLLGELLRTDRPLRVADIAAHPASVGFPAGHPPMQAFLGVPIRHRDRIVGAMFLTEPEGRATFDRDDEELVQALAAHASVAIVNAELHEEQRRRTQSTERLVGAIGALVADDEPEQVLRTVVETARVLAEAEYAALGVLTAGAATGFERFIPVGMSEQTVARLGGAPQGRGLLAAVTVEGRPIRLDDLGAHPASVGFPEGHPAMTSFLGVPLRVGGQVLGNLYLANKVSGPAFTEEDERLVVALAAQAAVAIERSRIRRQEQEANDRLLRLLEANLAMTFELDPDAILQIVADLAREVVGARYAALGVLSDTPGRLDAFIHSGMPAETVARIGDPPVGRGVLGAVVVGGRPIRLARIADHPASVGFPEHHPPMASFLGVPLVARGEVLGNLYLAEKKGGPFTEEDESVLQALAAQAAVAISNARALQRERDAVEELKRIDRMKTDFVGLVSHELRTPLVALVGGSTLLDTRWSDLTEEQRRALARSQARQGGRLHAMVRNLLDMSKIEQGRLVMAPQAVDLGELAAATVADLTEDTDRLVLGPVDAGPAWADPTYVRQMVSNLVVNALSYGGPRVQLHVEEDADHVLLHVRDDGPPLPAGVERILFERFLRGPDHDDEHPGAGLGLALVRSFAAEQGGDVRYRRDGGWTTFTLSLPRAGQKVASGLA